MTQASTPRPQSAIDAVADAYVGKVAELDPLAASAIGLPGYDHLMSDLSPAGHDARAELDRSTLRDLEALAPTDDVDRVTLAAMRERLGLAVELHEAGEPLVDLNVIASPLQGLRDIFDIMPTGTVEAWENIASRLNLLPGAVDGYIASLSEAARRGNVPAIRQVREGVTQARELAGAESFFTSFVHGKDAAAVLDDSSACSLVRKELEHGATAAREAYDRLAAFLESDLAPQAPEADGVGRERYGLFSRQFLGATVDLDETYAWGVEELARIVAEQTAVAQEIAGPGATVEDAVARLEADPKYQLHGTEALRAWMQETADQAIADLDGVHFDISGPVRTIECMIAPTQTGGIYYTPPSDDFSRPGRMWWSVPPGVTEFGTWREKTTVFHEGVPGHHLQCAEAVVARDTLNSWRRLMCWVSGHGEGWALYAEKLMDELGYLSDPGDRLGMLDAQRMRAARVVFDIGVHLGLEAPQEWGGGRWDADKAWPFLKANVNMNESFVRFEYNRYLGWPGQAPSYKVGQRLWEQARDEARTAAGASWDAKQFHARALALGSVGLDVLRDALA
ncbi:protein of unknown function DUF885 [Xylanimonas cellulosilytica DSM 15894]|uniref:DUF885 domain-containing protein n=1 Tax=Xylanimonas cellulosilytica (strain DSM 15894 / JCM 12276 / CECT 5975 / KCTC 9989 / LMG 20990 / NBRC 107835 / XIL07) TaxID=446471 RepID=D1BYX1_XYLCX|nr:DUF885 domain-containing protein [Xylanimonas cellulosilytica]ACZ30046.1 protein of unknown function DUF885 [Xylanimonas cellulosilytica DSM 15894]